MTEKRCGIPALPNLLPTSLLYPSAFPLLNPPIPKLTEALPESLILPYPKLRIRNGTFFFLGFCFPLTITHREMGRDILEQRISSPFL